MLKFVWADGGIMWADGVIMWADGVNMWADVGNVGKFGVVLERTCLTEAGVSSVHGQEVVLRGHHDQHCLRWHLASVQSSRSPCEAERWT